MGTQVNGAPPTQVATSRTGAPRLMGLSSRASALWTVVGSDGVFANIGAARVDDTGMNTSIQWKVARWKKSGHCQFESVVVALDAPEVSSAKFFNAAHGDDGFAFAFNPNYLWMERYRTIDKLTLTTMVGAMIGVYVISLLFLDLTSATLVVVCVVAINLNLCK